MLASPQMCSLGRLYLTDVPACAALEQEIFADQSPWSEQAFRQEIDHPASRVLALRLGSYWELSSADLLGDVPEGMSPEQLVGYGACSLRGDPTQDPEFEVLTVALDPRLRGAGWGRLLFEALLWGTEKGTVFLEVRADNATAISLYESCGFEVFDRRPKYYQPAGVDALIMRRLPVVTDAQQSAGPAGSSPAVGEGESHV